MSEPVHVLVAADRRFLWGCAVSVRSLLDRASCPVALTVVHDSLRPGDADTLEASWGIRPRFVRLDRVPVAGLQRSRAISRMMYARLLMADLFPESVERCVYVDSDVLFGRDVAGLAGTDLGGRVLGAAPNGNDREDEASQLARLGLPAGGRYFNSGVLVVDLARWRAENVGPRAMAVSRERDLVMPDQDALNVVLDGQWLVLPQHWNTWAVHASGTKDTVVHYAMSPKPWHADYRGPFVDEFFRCLDRTAFAGQRPARLFGIAPALVRARRKVPYLPGAFRALRRALAG